jgi:hypothetical protein
MAQLGPFPFLYPNSRQSPTLLPNFSMPVGSNGRGLQKLSPAQFLVNYPRVNATATATVGGTAASGDIVTVTLTNPVWKNPNLGISGGSVTVSFTLGASDTLASTAEALASLINESAAAPFVTATASEAVLTISWPGPVGNFTALAKTVTGAITLTLSAASLSGGSGPTYVWDNFQWTARSQVSDYFMGNFYLLSGNLYGIVQGGQPVQ